MTGNDIELNPYAIISQFTVAYYLNDKELLQFNRDSCV
jgi:hypothetical protein